MTAAIVRFDLPLHEAHHAVGLLVAARVPVAGLVGLALCVYHDLRHFVVQALIVYLADYLVRLALQVNLGLLDAEDGRVVMN